VPPLPNADAVIKIQLRYTYNNDFDALNTFHVVYASGAPSIPEITTFAFAVATAWLDNLAAMCSGAVILTNVACTDLTTDTSSFAEAPVDYAGTRSGTILPASTSVVISQLLTRRYRGGHPRNYWPMGVEADLGSAQVWSGTFVAEVGTAFNSFINQVDAAIWSGGGALLPVAVSYYHGFTVVVSPTTGRARNVPTVRPTAMVEAVSGFQVRSYVGTQRRRLEVVG
jgi:hypothetical protein